MLRSFVPFVVLTLVNLTVLYLILSPSQKTANPETLGAPVGDVDYTQRIEVKEEVRAHLVCPPKQFSFEEDVTIGIKTFERPNAPNSLIKSIRAIFPNIRIIVANDGSPFTLEDNGKCQNLLCKWLSSILGNTTMIQLEYDRGLSEGRNEIVKRVTTEYFWLMDDDFYVPSSMKEKMPEIFDIMLRNNLGI
jgi:hypothetical protein